MGDTLLILDQPEVQEQLRLSRASLEQVEATAGLAQSTLTRWRTLSASGVVTPQEFDERQAAANVADANVRVSRANIAALSEVLLLTLVQTDTLRVMLSVPQTAASQVRVGQRAAVVIAGAGDAAVDGRVARTARAINPATRTLLTEVHLPNRDRRLLPGTFATVRLSVPTAGGGLRIPAIALIIRAEGPDVAQVVDGRVTLLPVVLGRDFGTSIELVDGIAEGADRVVNSGEQLVTGALVKAVRRAGPPATPAPQS